MDELSVQDMGDEELAQLLALSGIPDQQAQLMRQQIMAQRLQQTPTPQGRQAGGAFVAANPLEFLGAGMQQFAGMRKEQDATRQLDELRKQQIQARQLFGKKLMDTPYRRSTQPFIRQLQVDEGNVPMPSMGY
jgi:hypothetical protein